MKNFHEQITQEAGAVLQKAKLQRVKDWARRRWRRLHRRWNHAWNRWRRVPGVRHSAKGCRRLCRNPAYRLFGSLAIIANVVVLCMPYDGMPASLETSLERANIAFASFFIADMIVHMARHAPSAAPRAAPTFNRRTRPLTHPHDD